MKSLADLKRDCQKYVWIMRGHSWFPSGKMLGVPRKIAKVQSNAFMFEPVAGSVHGSWLSWPKASQLKIVNKGVGLYEVEVGVRREPGLSILYSLEAI